MNLLISYALKELERGVSTTDLCKELLEDKSMPGRAFSRKTRVFYAEAFEAQAKIRRKLNCSFQRSFAWFLTRKNKVGWEEVKNMTVQAGSAREARRLAASRAGEEGKKTWEDSRSSSCTRLPDGGSSRVIAETFLT
ncbi:MAG: hypothetical protein WC824_09795 [Bacteroidota bacterium]|jgi:hypothetical protein